MHERYEAIEREVVQVIRRGGSKGEGARDACSKEKAARQGETGTVGL